MKYKTKEQMQDNVDSLGMAALSKFSSINHLCKTGIPIEGLLAIESLVREIECGLWSLVPLGLGNDKDTFENQIQHLTKKFHSVVEAAKAMKFVKDGLS